LQEHDLRAIADVQRRREGIHAGTAPLRAWALAAWRGLAASILAALVETVVVELTPHARGVGFYTQLRFSVVALASVIFGTGAGLGYRLLAARFARPRLAFSALAAGSAATVLLAMASIGPHGLAAAGAPAVLCAAMVLAFLVPRFSNAQRHSRIGAVALALLALLELVGVALGVASERAAPAGAAGMAFVVPLSLFDVEHKFVDLPSGAHIHYVDEGRGDTLLFLHGNPSWSFQWRNLIYGLRDSHRCVALDYPGFGLSTAPSGFGYTPREMGKIVEEFVEHLGLRDVTLVMHDWGGPIGLDFAGRRPELVRALIVGNTWAWQTRTGEARGKWSVVAGGPIGEFIQMNFNGIDSFAIERDLGSVAQPDVIEMYERPFLPLDRRGVVTLYPQQITAANEYFVEVEERLARLADRRMLIFWGLRDVGFTRSDLERWQRLFPNHEVHELPNASHFFFEDAPDQVVAQIRAFASGERVKGTGAL
jgi:pimeloyl-ACP methyl ester carboxylesterase